MITLTLTDEQARAAWLGLVRRASDEFRAAGECAMTGRPHEVHNANAVLSRDTAREIERLAPHVAKPLEARCDS